MSCHLIMILSLMFTWSMIRKIKISNSTILKMIPFPTGTIRIIKIKEVKGAAAIMEAWRLEQILKDWRHSNLFHREAYLSVQPTQIMPRWITNSMDYTPVCMARIITKETNKQDQQLINHQIEAIKIIIIIIKIKAWRAIRLIGHLIVHSTWIDLINI